VTGDKVTASAADAVADIPDGARLGIGGFGPSRTYQGLIPALLAQGARDLRVVANSIGGNPNSIWTLLEADRISHVTVSISRGADEYIRSGAIGIELVPQGTLVERLRAGGAGIAAFYTRTGYGTKVAEGKEVRWFGGEPHILEQAIELDYAFIRARRADRFGNVAFHGVGPNLNPSMAKSAKVVIVEATEIVDVLDPEEVDLPGVFVTRIIHQAPELVPYPKVRRGGADIDKPNIYLDKPAWTRREMAQVAASLLPDSCYVNLGLGIPTLVSNFTTERGIVIQSENGMLGVGEDATPEDYDQDVYNAASWYVRRADGASFFDSVTSFEMIRAGKLDYVVLGALQVDAQGDLANWATANRAGGTIGGAMDLAASRSTLIVMMPHLANDGSQKLVHRCTFPLTGVSCVDLVVTDLCVLRRSSGAFRVERIAPGFSGADLSALTEMPFEVADSALA
jgi:3-oxoacid CoA-transferase